jgi:hypothetical protein
MNFQDKYISTLEEILSLRQDLQSKSLLIIKAEENISLKICQVSDLERKVFGSSAAQESSTPIATQFTDNIPQPPLVRTEFVTPHRKPHENQGNEQSQTSVEPKRHHEGPKEQEQENTPKYKDSSKPKKVKTSAAKAKKKKHVEPKKKITNRKSQETEKKEKELPPIDIDPTKYVEWNAELQESGICWNEIIKSTHPGSLSHMNFTEKFRIEQAVHDFLSTKLHWKDIQYCVALNRLNIPIIAIPEDWVDEFSDWFSERVGAGLLDSKVKPKKRNAKMQQVLGIVFFVINYHRNMAMNIRNFQTQ